MEREITMPNTLEEKILELIGITDDRRIQVLKAVFSGGVKYGVPIGINEISDEIQTIFGEKIATPLIYRYLKSLDGNGLIMKTQTRPAKYWVDLEAVVLAVERLYNQKINELQIEKREIQKLKRRISETDLSIIADRIVSKLTQKALTKKSISVIGLERIVDLINREILNKANKGDIIRFCLDLLDVPVDFAVPLQNIVAEILKHGVEFRVLSTSRHNANNELFEIRKKKYRQMKNKYRISYRYLQKPFHSYQFAALNNESFVMILANNPYSAVWIPDGKKDAIVNDAIRVFDNDWKKAVDMLLIQRE